MRDFGVYLVVGTRAYRGHEPGTEFAARLDRNAERRALERGNIRLVARIVPALEPGSYRLPPNWPPPASTANHDRPRGGLFVGREG